jgi:hypothetical protein
MTRDANSPAAADWQRWRDIECGPANPATPPAPPPACPSCTSRLVAPHRAAQCTLYWNDGAVIQSVHSVKACPPITSRLLGAVRICPMGMKSGIEIGVRRAELTRCATAVNKECCDEPTEVCSGGQPQSCNAACAKVSDTQHVLLKKAALVTVSPEL